MNQNYTSHDLLLYAYNETELSDSVRMQHCIDSDPLVADEYSELIEAVNSLDQIFLEPEAGVLNRIMAFAEGEK